MASFTERMMGAAKLDVQVYEEVEADTGAQAKPWELCSCPVSLVGSDRLAWALEVLAVSLAVVSRR